MTSPALAPPAPPASPPPDGPAAWPAAGLITDAVRAPFSGRRQQVANLLAQGRPDKQIARVLGLSPSTVKGHVSAILRAVEAETRGEAAYQLTLLGWVRPPAGLAPETLQ